MNRSFEKVRWQNPFQHRLSLAADKATVTANDNRIANYGAVGIKIDQPVGSPLIVGNSFESDRDRAGVVITGGSGIVENNRVETPKPSSSGDADAQEKR